MYKVLAVLVYGAILQSQIAHGMTGNDLMTMQRSSRIIGGYRAQKGQFPSKVSMRSPTGIHFCGATIISEFYVMTAAHCVFYKTGEVVSPRLITILGGEVLVSELNRTRYRRKACAIIPYPKFNLKHFRPEDDIAIIKVSKSWQPFNRFISPAELPRGSPKINQSCTVSGWGITLEGLYDLPDRLMWVEASIIDNDICNKQLKSINVTLTDKSLCAGHMEGGKDACQGDSGGALMCEQYVSGIVSAGWGCARVGYPGWFTDVYQKLDWIKEKMSRTVCRRIRYKDIFQVKRRMSYKSKASALKVFDSFSVNIVILLSFYISVYKNRLCF